VSMNNNSKVLYLSLLPAIVLVALILGAGYLLLRDDIKFFDLDREPQVRRIDGFPAAVPIDVEIEKQREIITNEEELKNFLSVVDPNGSLNFDQNINFNRIWLIGVSTGTKYETGTTIRVNKLYENEKGDKYKVSLREVSLPDHCSKDELMYVSVDIAAVSKTDHHFNFEVIREESAKCN
jgi:hypothetical protein